MVQTLLTYQLVLRLSQQQPIRVNIAKHGNRSASSNGGSADLLEEAGAQINLSPEKVAYCIENLGIGFMFALTIIKLQKK